ncbi:hypothetical protein SAMN05216474_0189 [Lishizhenia tianjinensis]|uniref:Uncharacterized protein n=1 Tax=Lishizhenia tianjinensis TaxID=477690 RepID=A0A1I6XH44_9FLAO|nr:hypothetical protein [Lishizhenia tianjinensis]SFT37486.1 hypothetical protein SAMN05216474_0189 [Lishizhenia tianjinensis]
MEVVNNKLLGLVLAFGILLVFSSSTRNKKYFEGELFFTQSIYSMSLVDGKRVKGEKVGSSKIRSQYKEGNEFFTSLSEEGDTLGQHLLDVDAKELKFISFNVDTLFYYDLRESLWKERILEHKDTVVGGEKAVWIKYETYKTSNYKVYPWIKECIVQKNLKQNKKWYRDVKEFGMDSFMQAHPYVKIYQSNLSTGEYSYLMEMTLDSVVWKAIELREVKENFGKDLPKKRITKLN